MDPVFQKLCTKFRSFGPVVTDLFASRLNYKVFPYVSWIPDPFCSHVDTFTMQWQPQHIYYAYPHFSMLTYTLQKIHNDQANVLLIFPLWPNQIWFSKMLDMLLTHIQFLPPHLPPFLPWDPQQPHPMGTHVKSCSVICDRLKALKGALFSFDLTNSSANSSLWLFKP